MHLRISSQLVGYKKSWVSIGSCLDITTPTYWTDELFCPPAYRLPLYLFSIPNTFCCLHTHINSKKSSKSLCGSFFNAMKISMRWIFCSSHWKSVKSKRSKFTMCWILLKNIYIIVNALLEWRIDGRLRMTAYWPIVANVMKYWNIGQINFFCLRRTLQIRASQTTYAIETISFRTVIKTTNTMRVTSMPNW